MSGISTKRVTLFERVTRFSFILPFFFALALLATYLVRHHVFFWDTVQLGSKHAHFYYETGFTQLLLPEEMDSGHPPTFGMYLASLWMLFGKNLPVSHFAMLPFIWGILYFLWKIGKQIAGEQNAVFLLLLAVADPTLSAQCLLVSPDVALVCFFVMGVYAVLQDRNWLKALAMLGLAMISMRGMMTVAALFFFEIGINFNNWKTLPKLFLQKILLYLPAGLFGIAFLSWHYMQTGWIGYHADSPWALSFSKVPFRGFLKNGAVLVWRMLDFGRVFVVAFVLQLQFVGRLQKVGQLRALFIISILVLTPTLLLYTGLSAHRYLLPLYVSLTLLFFAAIFQDSIQKITRYGYIVVAFIGLLTGNLWIYPDCIAQGWDATLAHLPYYRLRAEMLDYIQTENIPLDYIGTAFPEIGPLKFRDLSGRETGFIEKDLSNQSYILYSSVMNDFTDEERFHLQKDWKLKQVFSGHGVRLVLYQKREKLLR